MQQLYSLPSIVEHRQHQQAPRAAVNRNDKHYKAMARMLRRGCRPAEISKKLGIKTGAIRQCANGTTAKFNRVVKWTSKDRDNYRQGKL